MAPRCRRSAECRNTYLAVHLLIVQRLGACGSGGHFGMNERLGTKFHLSPSGKKLTALERCLHLQPNFRRHRVAERHQPFCRTDHHFKLSDLARRVEPNDIDRF